MGQAMPKRQLLADAGFIGKCIALAYVLFLVNLGFRWLGFDWNGTDSAPKGIYRLTHEPLIRGALVRFCLPTTEAQLGYERGYISKTPWYSFLRQCPSGFEPLLKPIVAVAGDMVTLTPYGVWVNGQHVSMSFSQDQDSHGRPLPHWQHGNTTLVRGEFWALSTLVPNSWDSRYFGPIHTEQVLGTATPWLVWPTTAEAQP